MTRSHDWPQKLATAIDALAGKRFQYGTFDCCIAAAYLIESMTGTDLMAGMREKYSDENTAQELISSLGSDLSDVVSKIAEQHGLSVISPLLATQGDLVLARNQDNQPTVGVIGTDGRYALCASANGLNRAPVVSHVIRAWRV